MTVGAIVPAAGAGPGLRTATPAALHPIGGVPMLVHVLRTLARCPAITTVVVAAPAAHLLEIRRLVAALDPAARVSVVAGGGTRTESVTRALAVLPAEVDVVVVHDGDRPLAPPELVAAVVAAASAGARAVVAALPVSDTVKRVDRAGAVQETLDRDRLRSLQTPQAFVREVLAAAHATPAADGEDDATLAERLGESVTVVAGHPDAFEVHRPLDLVLAEAVLARRHAAGTG